MTITSTPGTGSGRFTMADRTPRTEWGVMIDCLRNSCAKPCDDDGQIYQVAGYAQAIRRSQRRGDGTSHAVTIWSRTVIEHPWQPWR